LGLLDPLTAVVISFCFLGVMLYKRVNLGITLNATAIFLALLSLDWRSVPNIAYKTIDPLKEEGLLAISVILATFGIMWLIQLYKETREIAKLSESLSRIVKNPKIVLSLLPAVIGFLPVAGGALMSAPIVDSEAEKLKLRPEKKAYVNLWFRHTIFPVYPLSQVLIVTAALTQTALFSIILLQIPTVIVMVIVGFLIGFWKVSYMKNEEESKISGNTTLELKSFLLSFSPIMATIVVAIFIDALGYNLSKQGFDVLVATFAGLVVLAVISRLSFKMLLKPLKSLEVYGVTLAVYGAFLLRNVMIAAGISEIFKPLVANGTLNILILLTVIPAVLGFLIGSPSGAIAIGVSILAGVLNFSSKTAALLYISAYLGYVIAPTHLCFTFTADYFKSPLGKVYKYVIPSFIATFITALLVYFLPFSI
jgi:integral membrane protein (TIGR00529 family)